MFAIPVIGFQEPKLSSACLVLLLSVLILPAPVQAAGLYADTELLLYSEPVAIDSMLHDWAPPFYGGKTALTHDSIELGFADGDWRFAVLKRYDHELRFSSDTAEFYYLTTNKLALPPGRVYDLDLDVRHTSSDGFKLGRRFQPRQDLALDVSLAYLRGRKLVEGDLSGYASVINNKDYDYAFAVDYFYSKDTLFKRSVSQPHGDGYSVDLDVSWQATERLRARVTVRDMLARIFWRDAPFTRATATSDLKTYDADGYVTYRPLVSGLEGNRDFVQALPRRTSVRVDYDRNARLGIAAIVDDSPARTFYRAGIGVLRTAYGEWSLLYYLREQALDIGFHTEYWHLAVTTDSLDFGRSRLFGLVANLTLPY